MSSVLYSYPIKIRIAWGEAISGNSKIRDWLIKNGYQELGLFCFALTNKEDARVWLMTNGFSHLMALINAAEGNPKALEWLGKHGFVLLKQMALAIDNDVEAMNWLFDNTTEEIVVLTRKMQFVKNRIDEDNQDAHKFNNS